MRYVVAIVLLLGGLSCLGYAIRLGFDREQRFGGEAIGTVVAVEEDRSRDALHRRARVRYAVNGTRHEVWTAYVASGEFTEGQSMAVRYDPADPADGSVTGFSSVHLQSWTLSMFGLVALLLSALTFALARAKAAKDARLQELMADQT